MQAVSKRFGQSWAVRELDIRIEAGQTVALIGPSGCGKTTTLRMMNRLTEPTSGRVEVLGQDIARTDPNVLRRRIGYVIQEVGLFPHYDVRRNIAVVPELLGWDRRRIHERVDELMELVNLPPAEFAHRFPRQLSGGQRQRVGIARALAADPELVLLDEPFGALDPITRESLQDQFLSLSRRLKKTFVLVTHDIFEAVRLADCVVLLREGLITQIATPAELVRKPADKFAEAMLGRHRYQLSLMTVTLRDAIASRGTHPKAASAPGDPAAIELSADLSIWDALDRMERERAERIRVREGEQTFLLSRGELLEAAR
jgi:osmoprotectant transport system ATP-binding protein